MGERNSVCRISACKQTQNCRTGSYDWPCPGSMSTQVSLFNHHICSPRLVFGNRSSARRVAGTPNRWESQLTFSFQCHSLCRKTLRVFAHRNTATDYLVYYPTNIIVSLHETDDRNRELKLPPRLLVHARRQYRYLCALPINGS